MSNILENIALAERLTLPICQDTGVPVIYLTVPPHVPFSRELLLAAMAIDPEILLMDEPFGALDAQTRNLLQKELLEIWQKTKKTIIFVTHSVDEAVYLADRLVVLSSRPGRVCEIIPIELDRPRNRTSAEFAQLRRKVLDLIAQPKCTLQ